MKSFRSAAVDQGPDGVSRCRSGPRRSAQPSSSGLQLNMTVAGCAPADSARPVDHVIAVVFAPGLAGYMLLSAG